MKKSLYHYSAVELRDLFLSGAATAEAICESHLTHIRKTDAQVGAFLSVLEERALQSAARLDAKRAAGKTLGKLAAVPVAIKDNLHIKGEITTCASRFLASYRAPFEATAVRLLEEEDALLIGKTNMDEFAMGSSTEHSAYQITRNPWNLSYVPGGSSGGSAAAVSACMSPLSLGTDTGGSIRQPASFCGVVGFKPTYGRVSRHGVVAFSSSLDHVGPFGRTVDDVALCMEVLGRHCDRDSTSIPEAPFDYTREKSYGVKGLTIAVPWAFIEGLKEEVLENFKHSLKLLEDSGAKLVSVDLSILKYSVAVYYILAAAEASTNLARFDGVRYGLRSKEAKTIAEVFEQSKEEGFGPEVKRRILLGTYVLSSSNKEHCYRKAQQVRATMIQVLNNVFKEADLIALPTSPTTAFGIDAVQDPLQMYLADIYTIGADLAGIPAISVPSGFDKNGLPFSLQLMGPQKNDHVVLRAAYAFEKAAGLSSIRPPLVEV